MPNELIFAGDAGLTLTATLTQTGAAVGSAIAMTESGTVAGLYQASVAGGTAAGVYAVVVKAGPVVEGSGTLRWDGANEVLSASQDSVTAIPTTPLLTSAYTAPNNTAILAIKAKTDALPVDPAAASGIPSAAAIATAVWAAANRTLTAGLVTAAEIWAYVTRTLTAGGGGGASASDVAAAVRAALAVELARIDVANSTLMTAAGYTAPNNAAVLAIKLKTDNLPADPASQAAVLGALGATSGNLAAAVLGATAGAGTVQAAMARINEQPAGVPVQLVPAAPVDIGLCRVYGYFSTPDGQPAAGVKIEFKFISPGFTRSARIVAGRTVVATTSKLGELASAAGPFLDLLRTDLLTTPGVTYQVSSAELGLKNKVITLTTATADLRALLAL